MSARAEILDRIRVSLVDGPARSMTAAGGLTGGHVSPERFAARVEEYRAGVTRCAPDQIAAAVAAVCARHDARRLVMPAALPATWLPASVVGVRDTQLDARRLAGVDGALTGSALGIVETGTVALDGGGRSGRRIVSLLPDLHICVVEVATLVATMHEALDALAPAITAGQPITFVSGPSATSDIELQRIEGVHGPRRLELLLVG